MPPGASPRGAPGEQGDDAAPLAKAGDQQEEEEEGARFRPPSRRPRALRPVVVRALSGEIVVSSAEVAAVAIDGGAGAHVGAVRAMAAQALGVGPGLQCRLLHGLRALEDSMCLADAFPPPAEDDRAEGDAVAEVTAIVDTSPAVSAMLEQFARSVEKLSETKAETFLPLFREGTGVERLIDILLQLGDEAAPAAHRFADWARHPHPTVRRLVAWAMGGLSRAAGGLLDLLADMVRHDPHEIVRYEAARSMFQIGEVLPLEALSQLAAAVADHEDDGLRVQAYRGLRVVAKEDIRVGLCARREVREALSPHLVRALADRIPEVHMSAMRALAKIDPTTFRTEMQKDLIDASAWAEAVERLDSRLDAARSGQHRRGGDRLPQRGAGGGSGGRLRRCPPDVDAPCPASAAPCGNEAEFPLLVGTLPGALRPEPEPSCSSGGALPQRRRPFTCDTSIKGEAAWACLPLSCIKRDATTQGQDLVVANRTMRSALLAARSTQQKGLRMCLIAHVFMRLEGVRLRASRGAAAGGERKELRAAARKASSSRALAQKARREYLKRYFSCYPQGAHFFRKLEGTEGHDPMQQWLFPQRGTAPQQDFEPFHQPRPMRSWRTVWGGDVRFLP